MKRYEIGYILKPNLEKDVIKRINDLFVGIFSAKDCKVEEFTEEGIRNLAYKIDHFEKGYRIYLTVTATPAAIAEFQRVVIITEDVIRHLIIDLPVVIKKGKRK
jgi:small subunit ribosomal protein S6